MGTKPIGGPTVGEMKAALLDKVVKAELARKRTADTIKISKLRALRLARDAEQPQSVQPPARKARTAKG